MNDGLPPAFRRSLFAAVLDSDDAPIVYVDPTDDPKAVDDDLTTIVACDKCKLPLNLLTAADGEDTWTHTRSWEKHDHDPIPVRMPRDHLVKGLCDFCGQQVPTNWSWIGNRVGVTSMIGINDYGSLWAACDACDEILQTGNLHALADRVFEHGPNSAKITLAERPAVADHWYQIWSALFVGGPERRYTGPPRQPARLTPQLMPKLHQGLIKFWSHRWLYERIAAHGNHVSQSLPMFCVDPDNTDEFVHRVRAGQTLPEDAFNRFTAHLIRGLHAAADTDDGGLFWISSEFTQIATMAAHDFTDITFSREQLPAKFGFIIWEDPIGVMERPDGTAHFRAATWTLIPGGIWLNLYFQGEEGDPSINVEQMRADIGWLMSPNPGSGFKFDETFSSETLNDPRFFFLKTIIATWLLMTQPGVAQQDLAPVDKKKARAHKRATGTNLPEVRIINLRRRPARAEAVTGAPRVGKPLAHRRYTRGHWKNQFFGPKRGQRKLIYISPYISGPDNAPVKAHTPTVKVLR